MSVTLIIKTPNLKLPDQTFCCQPQWSVSELKRFLQQQYPTNPQPEEQRLIYSGRLLCDSEILKEFLRDLDSELTHTIHLVYLLRKTNSGEPTDETENHSRVYTPEALREDGLRQRINVPASIPPTAAVPPANGGSQLPVWGAVANQAGDPLTQQLLWWQQTYAQQAHYWAQYMQHQHYHMASTIGSVPSTTAASIQAAPTAAIPAPEAPVAPVAGVAAEVDGQAPEAQRRGPLVMGLAAAQDDEEDGGIRVARDWLDWIYVGSRLAILLAVMYYYSSLSRFILVTLIVAGIYLYQKTIRRRLVLENLNEVNNNVNNDAAPADDEVAENAPAAAHGEDVRQAAQPRPTANPNALNIALNVLVGFFTSLIPDVPAPEALN